MQFFFYRQYKTSHIEFHILKKMKKMSLRLQEVLKLGSLLSGSADNPHIVYEGESANTAQGL